MLSWFSLSFQAPPTSPPAEAPPTQSYLRLHPPVFLSRLHPLAFLLRLHPPSLHAYWGSAHPVFLLKLHPLRESFISGSICQCQILPIQDPLSLPCQAPPYCLSTQTPSNSLPTRLHPPASVPPQQRLPTVLLLRLRHQLNTSHEAWLSHDICLPLN